MAALGVATKDFYKLMVWFSRICISTLERSPPLTHHHLRFTAQPSTMVDCFLLVAVIGRDAFPPRIHVAALTLCRAALPARSALLNGNTVPSTIPFAASIPKCVGSTGCFARMSQTRRSVAQRTSSLLCPTIVACPPRSRYKSASENSTSSGLAACPLQPTNVGESLP